MWWGAESGGHASPLQCFTALEKLIVFWDLAVEIQLKRAHCEVGQWEVLISGVSCGGAWYGISLVGGLEHFYFFHFIYGIILPIDELIFFRGVGIPPTK